MKAARRAGRMLSYDVQQLSGLIRDWREEHRSDRTELQARVARIEAHLGLGSG
jgi:hypothetical protein